MKKEMTWTWPISSYIFLGGLGGGIAIVSAVADIFWGLGGIFAMGPFIAAVIIALASGLLVFELGRPLRFWRVMVTKKLSEMTFGAWMLTLLMIAGLVYSSCWLTLLPWYGLAGLRHAFAWICLILGIGVALYTGVFLGTMKSRPFWNGPALPVLFLILSLSTGLAAQILIVSIWPWGGSTSQAADITPLLGVANIGFLVTRGNHPVRLCLYDACIRNRSRFRSGSKLAKRKQGIDFLGRSRNCRNSCADIVIWLAGSGYSHNSSLICSCRRSYPPVPCRLYTRSDNVTRRGRIPLLATKG